MGNYRDPTKITVTHIAAAFIDAGMNEEAALTEARTIWEKLKDRHQSWEAVTDQAVKDAFAARIRELDAEIDAATLLCGQQNIVKSVFFPEPVPFVPPSPLIADVVNAAAATTGKALDDEIPF